MTQTANNGTHNITHESLAHFTGTVNYYRYGFLCRQLRLTDGPVFLSRNGAGWLIDVIASYQNTHRKLNTDPMLRDFQIWELNVRNGRGVVTCKADQDYKPVITQRMDTDFPLDHIKLYVERAADPDGKEYLVLMLPSER
jgi:hypothetical protein